MLSSILVGMLLSLLLYWVAVHWINIDLVSSIEDVQEYGKIRFLLARGILFSLFLFFISYILYISDQSQKLRQQAEDAKRDQLEARLYALQQQINPHFLFNALNTLLHIAQDQETKKYVLNFSEVFRYQLNKNDKPLATLREELDFTNAYLHILQERFEGALLVQIEIDETYLSSQLPPLTIQLLIENAVKHNIVDVENPLKIEIYVENEGGLLVVQNQLQLKSSVERGTGMGLKIIEDRYRLLAGKSICIENVDGYFRVSVHLLPNVSGYEYCYYRR
ncbi:histidine kinase [Niabella sp. CC-SYL272]|uniref:sensor histidine kinase n=1 Tax=Niabella agricola TaxID=2891571 RepID=UPI001F2C6519|nr:histidine kinase [Niabella agricola]MCF3107746.1 histidine kinase [Niabella agricola]